MFCTECGQPLAGDRPKFCGSCGSPVSTPAVEPSIEMDRGPLPRDPDPAPPPGTVGAVADTTPPEAEFPEGFYDDPFGGTWKRYWDGGRWLGKPDDSPDTAAEVVRGSAPPPTGEGYVPPREAVDPQAEQAFDVPAGLYPDPLGGMWKRQWNGLSWEAKPTDGPENLQAIRSRRVPPPSLESAERQSTVRASDGNGRAVGDATALGAKEIPAGYFVDPFGHVGRRYWTGTKWVGKKGDSPTETQAVLTGTAPLPSGNATRTNVATGHVQPRRSANPPNEAGLQWPSEDPLPVDQTATAAPRSGPLAGLSRTTWVIIGAAALSIVVVVALLNLSEAATNSETTSAQTVTPSEFQSVAGQLFPGCTITLDRAAPITETAVVDIAFAQNVAAQLWCGAVYLYRDRAGFNAPGESATRDFWKSNAESNFGENFAWLTCRNMKILLPQASTAWVGEQMRDFGC